jgi:Fe-S cluster assembly ATP-binding protein
MSLLTISNLHATVDGKPILKGVNLEIGRGEVHAVMGPNGSGKSTLANVIAGREGYEVTEGFVEYQGEDLLSLAPEERAHAGIFLAFQYPVEIPGVNNTYFLRAALNAQRKSRGEPELDSMQFLKLVREKLEVLHIEDDLLHRAVNEGFSGGEKKTKRDLPDGRPGTAHGHPGRNRFGPGYRRPKAGRGGCQSSSQ